MEKPGGSSHWFDTLVQSVNNGNTRFAVSAVSLSGAWTPDVLKPRRGEAYERVQEDSSDTAMVRADYTEECNALMSSLDVLDADIERLTPQCSIPALRPILVADQKMALAARDWKNFAIPLRYLNGRVYRIWATQDLYTEPTIKSVGADVFVSECARYTALERVRLERVKAQRDSLVILIYVGILLWTLLR
jgi:hypothetical protein